MLDTINRTAEELQSLLTQAGEPLVPELLYAAAHPDEARARPGMRLVLAENASLLEDLQAIPQLSYTLYRNVQRRTERGPYEQAYWTKRGKLALVALLVLLGDESALGLLHDYLWSTCEETTWVLPQVEQWAIELRAVAAAFDLAEIVVALGDRIEERVQQRVRDEIEQRVLSPYLENPEGFWWYRGHNNWTGVCTVDRPRRAAGLCRHGVRGRWHLDRGCRLLALRAEQPDLLFRDAAPAHGRRDRPSRQRADADHRALSLWGGALLRPLL